MAITTKELMLIQDNIRMTQNSISFMEGCVGTVSDPQIKNLCQQFIQDHQKDLNVLISHINPTTVQ